MSRTVYDADFRNNVIRLHLNQKRTIRSLSREYSVSTTTISRWVTVYRNTGGSDTAETKPQNQTEEKEEYG